MANSTVDNALHAGNARSRGLVMPSIIGHISRCGQEIANQEPAPPSSSLQAACCTLHGPRYSKWGHQTVHTVSSHQSRPRPGQGLTDSCQKKSIK